MELFHKILNTAVEGGASDVHIKPDAPVVYRISSQLVETEMSQQPDSQWLGNVIDNIVPEQFKPKLDEDREIDFSYNVPGIGRFRTNCFQHLGKWCLAMRHVVADVPKIDSLGLPEIIKSIAVHIAGARYRIPGSIILVDAIKSKTDVPSRVLTSIAEANPPDLPNRT